MGLRGKQAPTRIIALLAAEALLVGVMVGRSWSAEVSAATKDCLECHASVSSGIMGDWERSRHASVSPKEALEELQLGRRVSAAKVPDDLVEHAVGCAECHTLNADRHPDSVEHNGYRMHVVVTPVDCAVCHPVETEQYSDNLMAHAYGNLVRNDLYQDLTLAINGLQTLDGGKLLVRPPETATNEDSCLFCHGTKVEVRDKVLRETEMGEMEFATLSGWPNQGVGRINPDGSKGSCAACHTRHQFSIEMARKPHTCSECHKGPDVPAYKVFDVSKHGNLYSALHKQWDFQAVPWTAGKDFTAPTCAACHASLVVTEDGRIIAERTHRMSERLPWRIFGLIYAHPHPQSPDTSIIRNKGGLPLPTELTGEPVSDFVIDQGEVRKRTAVMQGVCLACHATSWVSGHWTRLENTLATTNAMTRTATDIVTQAWDQGLARGPGQRDSLFNEPIETRWAEQWLFYANTVRFSSAMTGADYGVFDNGRWFLSRNVREMMDWMKLHQVKVKR